MNATAVETLERRLDATRRALIGEQERLKTAVEAAAHAAGMVTQIEDGIRKSEQIISDLVEALGYIRGWAAGAVGVVDLLAACPSCGAKAGEPCRALSGLVLEQPHVTRGAPS